MSDNGQPRPAYFHRPVGLQLPAGVPIDQLLGVAANVANDLSRQGWDVCLPPMIVQSGGPLVGSQKVVNVVFWVRCPADSPLATATPTPPPGTHDKAGVAIAEAHGANREAVPV